ncbi:3491_t:CDS:1, partial [Acaulospora morrowiae]
MGNIVKQKIHQPDLRQRFMSVTVRTGCETLPLWIIRILFYMSGVYEQMINGLFFGKLRNQWCRSVSGSEWKGYLIGENAGTAEIGEDADIVIIYAH